MKKNIFLKKLFFMVLVITGLQNINAQVLGYEFPVNLEKYHSKDFYSFWQIIEREENTTDTFFCIYLKRKDTIMLIYPGKYVSIETEDKSILADLENKELTLLSGIEIKVEHEQLDDKDLNVSALDSALSEQNNFTTDTTQGIVNISIVKDSITKMPERLFLDYKTQETALLEASNVKLEYTRNDFNTNEDKVVQVLQKYRAYINADSNSLTKDWQIIRF